MPAAAGRLLPPRLEIAVCALAGIAVGVLTAFGQSELHRPLDALCNSASAWLVAPFAVGPAMSTRRRAAAAGLATCALQVLAYYATAHARGFATSNALIAFWIGCALIGGPIFGLAGHVRRTASLAVRGLGGTALPAAFAAEGMWVYLHQLHYDSTALLWFLIAAALLALVARRLLELRWLALTLPLGLLGEIGVSAVYRHTFA